MWNFACFGTTAGVLFLAVRDKDKDMRQTALGALAAGLLGGVSEPSLYGIHLRYKLIYKRMLVGCGLGGVVIAILGWLFPSVTAAGQTVHGVTTTTFAFTSLLTIPVFNQMWVYAVSIAVSFLTTFLLIITFDYRTPEQKLKCWPVRPPIRKPLSRLSKPREPLQLLPPRLPLLSPPRPKPRLLPPLPW